MKHLFSVFEEWFEYKDKRYCRGIDLEEKDFTWHSDDRAVGMILSEELETEYQKLKQNEKK